MKLKSIFHFLAPFLSAILLLTFIARGGTTVSNLLTYATISTTTNNGSPVLVGTAYIATTPTFNIQYEGLFATNDVLVRVQYGLDTNTFTTVATWNPASTNAGDGLITPSGITLSIYARTQIVTTNATDVGSKAIFVTP
jgi:hypothetical protein